MGLETYQCQEVISLRLCEDGVGPRWAYEAVDIRTIGGCVLANPEFAIGGVDGGKMDRRARVNCNKAEVIVCSVYLAGENCCCRGEREGEGDEREQGSCEGLGEHCKFWKL